MNYEDRISTVELNEKLKDHNISLNAILRCPTTEDRVNAALDGIGIAYVMRETARRHIENNELYEVKVPVKLPKNSIKIVYLKNQLTKVDKQFIKNYIKK